MAIADIIEQAGAEIAYPTQRMLLDPMLGNPEGMLLQEGSDGRGSA